MHRFLILGFIAIVTYILGEIWGNTAYNAFAPTLSSDSARLWLNIICHGAPLIPPIGIFIIGMKSNSSGD